MMLKASTLIEFKDVNLYNFLKNVIYKNKITVGDMLRLEILDMTCAEIENLDGLQYAKNLRMLKARANKIQDITPLLDLKNLENLDISFNNIENIFGIEGLKNLLTLNIEFNQITDMSPIASLESLKKIKCYSNPINIYFLPQENRTQISYFELIKGTDYYMKLSRLQRRLMDDVLFNSNINTISRILSLTPVVIPLVRKEIGEEELFQIVVKRIQNDTITKKYIRYLMKYSINNISGKDLLVHYGGKKARSLLMKILLTKGKL